MPKPWVWYALSACIVVADYLTKHWAMAMLAQGHSLVIAPCLTLSLAFNPGIAFSFFNQGTLWQTILLSSFATIMCLMLGYWLYVQTAVQWRHSLAIACILGGALGNLADRLRYGVVIDFIDFHWSNHHWPTFNLADTAVCIGTFFLLLASYRQEH